MDTAMKTIALVLTALLLSACSSIPEDIRPVTGFELDRYLGTWYEIARLDHRFERGLEQVTASYSLRDDGKVEVRNRGWSTSKQQWRETTATAQLVGQADIGKLEVTFFGLFTGDYVIFELGPDYSHAFVTGSENTLWLLSRTPSIDEDLRAHFIQTVGEAGYAVDEIIFVNQSSR